LVEHRRLISLLLVCSILTLLTVPQRASGQTVTETSIQSLTSTLESTVYSTIQINSTSTLPLRYVSTPYDFSYQTNSFSLYQMDTNPVQNYPCLYYDSFLFSALAGHEIRGHFQLTEEGTRIHFFILSSSQLRNFGNCGYGNWSWYLHTFASSYDFDWVVPKSAVYVFLFASTQFYGGSIYMTARDYSATPESSTETLTTTATYMLQSSQIALSTLTSVSSQQQPSTENYYYIAIFLIVILIVAGGFLTLKMKRPR